VQRLESSNSRGSYSSQARGVVAFCREASNLVSAYTRGLESKVERELERVRQVEETVARETGVRVRGLDVLDVGAGQLLLQMAYFARENHVVGIDQSVIVQGFDPAGYWRMFRTNGVTRVVKTLGRKALGIDRRYRNGYVQALRLAGFPTLKVLQMDASSLSFASQSFDVAYSLLVFQHLADPVSTAHEMVRVVRPGGVVYIDFTVYTGPSGALDVRILGGRESELPPWAHLRSDFKDQVHESAYLNRIRLPAWRRIFEEAMPGAKVLLAGPEAGKYESEARRLREQDGELAEYSLEELLTSRAIVTWRKPE
jgi:SAM-dependent methyltransferase